jgi:hypothetical protein
MAREWLHLRSRIMKALVREKLGVELEIDGISFEA